MRIHQQTDDEEQRPVRFSFCRSVQRDPQLKCLTLSLLIVLSLASVAWCRVAPRPPPASFPSAAAASSSHRGPAAAAAAGSSVALVGQCQHSGYVYFPVGLFCILYLVYLGECWHSSTHVSFRFPVDASAIYQQIRAMRLSPPIVWWRAVCYHYDRRLRQVMRYRRGDAYTSSQVFYERVNSQVTTTVFDYTHFGVIDASKRLVHLEKHPATKLRFSRKFSFACPLAEESYRQQRKDFLEEHQRIDDYLEFTEGLDLLNVRFDDQTVALSNPCHRPWYLYTCVFWAASIVLLSYPLRLLIGYKTAHVHYQVHKIFGVDRAPEFMTRILIRGDVAPGQGANGQLETAIRHNLSLAPSYAEALQISQRRTRFFVDGDFSTTSSSYGSIPLLPLGDRKPSSATAATSAAATSNMTGSHVTGLPVAGDDARYSSDGSRLTRCVVAFSRRESGEGPIRAHRKTTTTREDGATIVNGEQERRDDATVVASSSSASVVDESAEIRPDMTSESSGYVERDVRKRGGNGRIVARGRQANENASEASKQRDQNDGAVDTEDDDGRIRGKTLQEITAEGLANRPEIDQLPVDEEEEEEEKEEEEGDGGGGDDSSRIRQMNECSERCQANRLKRSVTSSGHRFECPSFVNHLKFQAANRESLESLESFSCPHHLNHRRATNQTNESPHQFCHLLNHHSPHRCDVHPGCEAATPRTSSAHPPHSLPADDDANPDHSEDIDPLELINESPPSYEDALRMRRFVLPITTGTGQHFRYPATSVDEIDEVSIGSPGHPSPDYTPADFGDTPSRSRSAVVIQIMETSL